MPTPADVSLAHARNPAGLATPVSGVVAEDLQAIFPNAPPRQNAPTTTLAVGPHGRRGQRPQARVAVIGAVAAAALAGLSAGALIGRHPAPAAKAQRTERVQIVLASKPETAEAKAKLAPVLVPRPAEQTTPQGLPGPGPLAPPQLVWTAAEVRAPPAVAKVKTASRPRAQRSARSRPWTGASPMTAPLLSTASRCRGACDYDDVVSADARLRRAYASAADAGVSRPVLVSYRDRWSNLRRQAPARPDHVVSRYDEMAQDLERYADSPSRAPSRRGHTLAGLRADLASLFP